MSRAINPVARGALDVLEADHPLALLAALLGPAACSAAHTAERQVRTIASIGTG